MAFISAGCGVDIDAPAGWIEADPPPSGALAVFYSPEPDSHGEASFSAKITVVEDSPSDLTLEEYVASSKQLLPNLVADFESADKSTSTLDGRTVYYVDTVFRSGMLPLRSRQLCVASDDGFYVVTAMALETQWDMYADEFHRALLSFRP